MDQAPLTIDVVSDVVCPWCYVGKRRLEQALAAWDGGPVAVRWHPFQLDDTIPPQGIARIDYLTRKFGSLSAVEPMHDRLAAIGREVGIPFDFARIARSPNTRDAHRVIGWAGSEGGGDAQGVVVEELMRGYFVEGRDIGDRAVLADAAAAAGMDRDSVAARLATEEDAAEVAAAVDGARRQGITGVPCFILGRRYALMGAQEPAALLDAMRKAGDPL